MSRQTSPPGAGGPWWRDAVVYQIYVRSFADYSADGVGDLAGVAHRLDHVAELGADAIWLTPFFPSPQHDHGYDVADYMDVEPAYGTLVDIDALIAACHARGMRVLADIVPNHCSSEHRWFQEALRAGPGSAERQRFFFRDGRGLDGELPPNNWVAMFGGPAWTRVEPDGQWYLHTFTPWQPDFDWSCPDVVEHFDTVLRFWFDRGIDGFRVDAVTHLGKAPELPDAPPPEAGSRETHAAAQNPFALHWPSGHDVWRHWREVVDRYEREHPGRELVTVAEAYTARRPDLLARYVSPDQFHQAFSFDLMLTPWQAAMMRDAIDGPYQAFAAVGASMTWALNNHDAQRVVTRLGRRGAEDPASWTGSNLIYRDAPVDVAMGIRRARAAVLVLAGLPGSVYLYQGEELGLEEVLDLPASVRTDPIFLRTGGRELGRDGCRVPLPWDADRSSAFGFSTGAATPWLPQPEDWGNRSVAAQDDDPTSMLALYRRVLAERRRLGLGVDGSLEWLLGERPELLAFRRRRSGVIVLLNPTDTAVDVAELPEHAHTLMQSSAAHAATWTGTIAADTAVWLRPS